ncbi:MAG: hypothetical protein ACT4P2_13905 [Pseudomonadota bacterium]
MRRATLVLGTVLALGPAPAAAEAPAAGPAAIVEDVVGRPAGVEFMDYLIAGRTIRLGPGDVLTLGYIRSCWRETVTGGTVTIGLERSTVVGGQVRREKVECDGGRLRLTAEQAAKSGVAVFRVPPAPAPGSEPRPRITLYGLSPLVEMKGAGRLVIERLDEPGERHEVEIGTGQLLRGTFYDFAKADRTLAPGGLYRAIAGERQVVFKVDQNANPGAGPLVGRLLRF